MRGLIRKVFILDCTTLDGRPLPKNSLDMNVEEESLRLEVLLSQPSLPPRYDLSPRRSPEAGMGLDEPGVPHPEMKQTEQE